MTRHCGDRQRCCRCSRCTNISSMLPAIKSVGEPGVEHAALSSELNQPAAQADQTQT